MVETVWQLARARVQWRPEMHQEMTGLIEWTSLRVHQEMTGLIEWTNLRVHQEMTGLIEWTS